jgi:hypothetical protein
MRSFRSDPYLWVHLAGVAAVPIFLELCLLGLGMGRLLMPIWFELLFVGGLGIVPILWMQWQQPFCIYSLLLLAVRPDRLSDDQRKVLTLFKAPIAPFLAVGVAVLMAAVLWELYTIAPIAQGAVFPNATRGMGLLWAAIAFFFANLFLQVPVSVGRVLLIGDRTFKAALPYAVEQVPRAFTLLGFRVDSILPTLIPKPAKPVIIRPVEPAQPKVAVVEEPVVEEEAIVAATIESVADGVESVGGAIEGEVEAVGSVEEGVERMEEAIGSADPSVPAAVESAPIDEKPAPEPLASGEEEGEGVTIEVIALADGDFREAVAAVESREAVEGAIAPPLEAEDWGDDDDLDDL